MTDNRTSVARLLDQMSRERLQALDERLAKLERPWIERTHDAFKAIPGALRELASAPGPWGAMVLIMLALVVGMPLMDPNTRSAIAEDWVMVMLQLGEIFLALILALLVFMGLVQAIDRWSALRGMERRGEIDLVRAFRRRPEVFLRAHNLTLQRQGLEWVLEALEFLQRHPDATGFDAADLDAAKTRTTLALIQIIEQIDHNAAELGDPLQRRSRRPA